MKTKRVVHIILLQLFTFIVIPAQDEIDLPFKGELDLKFERSEESKLIKAVRTIEEAQKKLGEAQMMFDNLSSKDKKVKDDKIPKELKKTFKQLEDAIETFDEGYYGIYDMYKEKCLEFWKIQKGANHRATGLEKAKYYDRLATKYLGRAQTRRNSAEVTNDFKEKFAVTKEANHYELIAIQCQGRALQIYQDFPVEYDYQWENDVDIEKILAEGKEEIVEEPRVEKRDTMTMAITDTITKRDTVVVYLTDTVFVVVKDTLNYQDSTITFRVQIAAHTIPLSKRELRVIYRGSRDIFMLQEEGWYKYSIGLFKDYEKAREVMKNSGVEKAFITPYLAGKKITLKEALDILDSKPPG